ncbi:hypothetical protein F383_23393 [Gossypium arboreum]|uniref:Uncharacterized protein n=1 Tax=Gossypium arboreum TaxID=29729 RepID=A0A0B0P348_GOSAR|nr:hypothetical protein F383_23393 [Gossypium arboreum]
MPPSPTPITA